MKKLVHNVRTKRMEEVDLTPAEIAEITAFQQAEAAKELLPKPGEDLLALAEAAAGVNDLRAVVVEMIRRVYGLPVEEPEGEALAESALSVDEEL